LSLHFAIDHSVRSIPNILLLPLTTLLLYCIATPPIALRSRRPLQKASNLPSSYIVVAIEQSLEPTRFFFQVETKDKGKKAQGTRGEEEEEGLYSPTLTPFKASLHLEEEDPFAQASRLFLKEFHSKKEALFSDSTRYSLSKEETLSPLQKKTKYLQFLNKRNLQSLALLSSFYKEDKEPLLHIFVLNLKKLLYLSLDKSRYVNSVPLQHLNSFQRGVVRNKPSVTIVCTRLRPNRVAHGPPPPKKLPVTA
jgi:hypothetical protein